MRFYLVGSFKGLDLVNILIIVGYQQCCVVLLQVVVKLIELMVGVEKVVQQKGVIFGVQIVFKMGIVEYGIDFCYILLYVWYIVFVFV